MSLSLNGYHVECNFALMLNIVGSHLSWIFGNRDPSKIKQMTQKVVSAYSEPHRGHHNLLHLREMLKFHAEVQRELELGVSQGVALGIIYHDSVYRTPQMAGQIETTFQIADPDGCSNEVLSNAVMLQEANGFIESNPLAIKVANRVIQVTAQDPDPPITELYEKLVHDFDYWVLGAPPTRYEIYREGILKEYAGSEDGSCLCEYLGHRRKFLCGLLESKQIFLTEKFHQKYEQQAKINVADEIKWLDSFNACRN